MFGGNIVVQPPPRGYKPLATKEEVLAKNTGPHTLAQGASSIKVFLGTVTDRTYARHGHLIINHRVAWVLYAVGVPEPFLGPCVEPASTTTTQPRCPTSFHAHLVEIVSPVTGNGIISLEY